MKKFWLVILFMVMLNLYTYATSNLEIVSQDNDATFAINRAYNTLISQGYTDTLIYLRKVIYSANIKRSEVRGDKAIFYLKEHPIKDMSSSWLASVLLHEAWHLRLRDKGKPWYGLAGEKVCLTHQLEYLKKYGAKHDIRWAEYVLRNIEDPAYQWWRDGIVIPPIIK